MRIMCKVRQCCKSVFQESVSVEVCRENEKGVWDQEENRGNLDFLKNLWNIQLQHGKSKENGKRNWGVPPTSTPKSKTPLLVWEQCLFVVPVSEMETVQPSWTVEIFKSKRQNNESAGSVSEDIQQTIEQPIFSQSKKVNCLLVLFWILTVC